MILYQLKKNNNKELDLAFGKWYAFPVITHTVGIAGLAKHMSSHNTGFSPGQVKGILADMVKCIKELVLDGVAVKIDDLAIFTLGIVNKKGADSKREFNVTENVESVKLRSRATGELMRSKLNLDASLKDIEKLTSSSDGTGDGESPDSTGSTTGGGGGSTSESGTGGSSSSGSGSDDGGLGL